MPRALALLAGLALALAGGPAPAQLLAQLTGGAPLSGGATVTVTAPTAGSPVRGTVTVTASATAGLFGIAGVQFKLDGVPIGAEDTTAPYSVSWNSLGAAEGWHSLTAVARSSLGVESTSEPVAVTVANVTPPPVPVTRYEETHPAVSFGSGWSPRDPDWFAWSGAAAVQSAVPGAQATFTFTGTAVTWIGYRSSFSGIARVSIDGVRYADVDLYAKTDEVQAPIFTATGLANGSHTLVIEATGMKNPNSLFSFIMVDAFDVPGPIVSVRQDSDPAIAYTAGWSAGDTSRAWSGPSATVSTAAGAQATFTFNGTGVKWIGYRAPGLGTASVFLDDVQHQVALSSPTEKVQDRVFTATGLAEGPHTLRIQAPGAGVVVDGFEVVTRGTRFEEEDWRVAYTGDWTQHGNRDRVWSKGTASESIAAGARLTFTFNGTEVRWLGARGPQTGIARVWLDGVFVREVDTYSPTEAIQDIVFTAGGLTDSTHSLTIEVTGQKNPASTETWVLFDGFDVRP